MKILILLFAYFELFIPVSVRSQHLEKGIEVQKILWLRYYNKVSLADQWQVNTEIDTRWFVFSNRQHQWLIPRITLHYQIKEAHDVGVGGAYFLQALPQDENQTVKSIRPEIRPHQEYNLYQYLGEVKVSHRYKIEERFFLKTTENNAAFNFRFRYKVQTQIPITKKENHYLISLIIFDEVMFNAGKDIFYNIFDQNRMYAGALVKLSKHWSTEIGYMNWFQQRTSGKEFYIRHIARFSVAHSI
ncbi:DUF2490 domain-containing protein [Catalinimonas sp. 4WD22]|uniref:DUF2490 domain-containing protein n=1 Tax=Catalinimonas locisalis TaxID=3133978 RepID=UPI00310142CE